jgi:hypothetical protein
LPFGVTYAVYATVIAVSVGVPLPSSWGLKTPPVNDGWVISYGKNAPEKAGIGKNGIYAIEYWSAEEMFPKVRPMWSIASDGGVGGYASFTLRRDFELGQFQISPYAGIAAHQRDWTNYNAKELIQYRTGFDISWVPNERVQVTAGFYHMSNFGVTGTSASIDVTRIAFVSRF